MKAANDDIYDCEDAWFVKTIDDFVDSLDGVKVLRHNLKDKPKATVTATEDEVNEAFQKAYDLGYRNGKDAAIEFHNAHNHHMYTTAELDELVEDLERLDKQEKAEELNITVL